MPIDEFFGPEEKSGFLKTVSDTYYTPGGKGTQLGDVLVANQNRYKKLLAEAVQSGKLTAPEAAARGKDFQTGRLGPHASPTTLKTLSELENEQFCLLRHPQNCADGLYRTQDYYVPPGALQLNTLAQGWDTSDSIPVADAVIVGAGPGGLSTAWQLARLGGRVVCFESELAGTAFSDAGAKAVHTMRTSADGTNLIQDGHALATLDHPLSLHGHLPAYRRLALAGQKAEQSLTGVSTHGVPPESRDLEDRNSPANRGELFEHLAQLSHSLATDFPQAFLCERSPVSGVEYEDGLFTVSTSRGHKVKARSVVLATGLTGTEGQQARLLPQFSSLGDSVTLLGKESDISEKASQLDSSKSLVMHDRLLGQQVVRQKVQSLPQGSRAAVVGSGESAVKAVLELVHLHPGLSVDLFCKEPMEAAQTQLPNENFHTAVLENTLQDPQAAQDAWEREKLFGTPVTPRTLQELLELQTEGRVRLLEMGTYFDQNSVDVSTRADRAIHIEIKSPEVQNRIRQSHSHFQASGLTPSDSQPFQEGGYGAVVQAVGYQKQPLQDHPLRHLPPEAHKRLHLNSAGTPFHPAETSLAGLSVRGRQLAETLAQDIPAERRVTNTVPQDRGVDWRTLDRETVQGIIDSRGLHPGFVASVGGDPLHPQYLQIKLPNSDYKLRELYRKREMKTITPAELEVLERALKLADRMDGTN